LLAGATYAQGPTAPPAADELALAALQEEAEPEEAPSEGLLRIPAYGGDLAARSTLTGDWGGARTRLAERGVQLDLRFNQYVQGVTEGGRERDVEYGGNADALILLDLMRMGVVPGALVKLRLESRYGDSVNGIAGPLLPVNTDHYFPLTDELDEDLPIAITTLSWTQFLSEGFGVYFGKLDTLDGDPNEFASGRGGPGGRRQGLRGVTPV
jgi:porin